MSAATGGLVNGSPVICGGYGKAKNESSNKMQSSCYSFDTPSQAWKLLAEMNSKRYYPSSVVTNEGLWVTGGFNADNSNLASTEYIYINGSVINGPNLPSVRSDHCMVTLPDGNILMMGGY